MRNQLLRDSDWAGMAHSLEIRLPFLDISLAQYLAAQRRLGNVLRKGDIPNTTRPPLPNEIQFREKTGFVIPIQDWANKNLQTNLKLRGLRRWQEQVFTLASEFKPSSHN